MTVSFERETDEERERYYHYRQIFKVHHQKSSDGQHLRSFRVPRTAFAFRARHDGRPPSEINISNKRISFSLFH